MQSRIQKSFSPQPVLTAQAKSVNDSSANSMTLQRHANLTGLPNNLKSGIEALSGYSMDDVRVHYNSSKPATVQALAYTQGTDIHVAPGQEKHLPHEAWHVAQQMAGRVSPTTNINGMPVNDNAALEHEADVMGEKAVVQRKACIKTRPLEMGTLGKWAYNWGINFGKYKKVAHSHIFFSGIDVNVNVQDYCQGPYENKGGNGNNIGFHCVDNALKGEGGYFSESDDKYEDRDEVVIYDDVNGNNLINQQNKVWLLQAIYDTSINRDYSIDGYNCQKWVEDVKSAYKNIRSDLAKKLKSTEMSVDKISEITGLSVDEVNSL